MSEVDLAGLENNVKEQQDTKIPTAMQEINLALKECGVGWFHVRLLSTSFVGLIAGVLVTNTTPFILPVAECDLNMNLLQKGLLNAMPYIGMTLVSIVAGFLTDTFGRKMFLVSGFGGLFLFTVIAGSSQSYEVLIISKFFEGILFAISFSAALSITSEFCYKEIRDRMLLLRSSFMAVAQILIAAMSWGILTQDWELSLFNGFIGDNQANSTHDDKCLLQHMDNCNQLLIKNTIIVLSLTYLHVWNFYIYIMSFWSLISFILYIALPESPRYYITQRKFDEARKILIKMYTMNTGKPVETFKYANLWKNKVNGVIKEEPEKKTESRLKHQLVAGLHNVKPMFRRPLVFYLFIISAMNFLSMALYNVIRLWFPQLSSIVEHYSSIDNNQDLCTMLDTYTNDLKLRNTNVTTSDVCTPTRSGNETYMNSIILGFVCIIPFAVSGILVNKVGKRNLYVAAAAICVGVTLGIRWANSKVAVVALFSVDAAISQTMVGLYQAFTMELFPTTTRTLAISVIMTSGRIGTLAGNVAFPILLDMGCVVPFYTLTAVMICVTFMAVFLPNS